MVKMSICSRCRSDAVQPAAQGRLTECGRRSRTQVNVSRSQTRMTPPWWPAKTVLSRTASVRTASEELSKVASGLSSLCDMVQSLICSSPAKEYRCISVLNRQRTIQRRTAGDEDVALVALADGEAVLGRARQARSAILRQG